MRVCLVTLPGMEGNVERVCGRYRENGEGSVPAVEQNEKIPRAVAQTDGRNNACMRITYSDNGRYL